MNALSEALISAIGHLPPMKRPEHGNDITLILERALRDAGYDLQLHQHGIEGTSIMAVKLENIALDVPTA